MQLILFDILKLFRLKTIFIYKITLYLIYSMSRVENQMLFPSYSAIKNNLINKNNAKQQAKINKLTSYLSKLQSQNDFKAQHQVIKNSILNLAHSQSSQVPAPQKQRVQWQTSKVKAIARTHNQSLNFYIDDDKEQENNFQTYLKFRKKALERDLQEAQEENYSSKRKRKQKKEQQLLFRTLYDYGDNKELPTQSKVNFFGVSRQQKRGSASWKSFDQDTQQTSQKQKRAYANNRKLLRQNYMQTLKKLQGSNIVKWRILNQENHQE